MTTSAVAELLGVSRGVLDRWRTCQTDPGIRYPECRMFGKRWYYRTIDVVKWMRAK